MLTDLIPTLAPLEWVLVGAYLSALLGLSVYGAHRWWLLVLYWRYRREASRPERRFDELPVLTVQVPLYNEMYVARRVVEAVCRLDYPRDKLEIQVLDDSTDETVDVVAEVVAERRAAGFDIVHLRRRDRTGYKAGALAEGLRRSRGELVAVFDADFVPPPEFTSLVHYFTDPKVGMAQARWGHLNRDHSPLTRVQSILLDGHFIVEHTARNRSGRFFNFNGTAGIWRRQCIDDAGGWRHDTLTEDMDLSYRAQLGGWRFVYVPQQVAPAELPVEMAAFKAQQHRWAKGSIQTAVKLLPTVLRSGVPWRVKVEAVFHLTANIGYLMMLVLALTVVPAVYLRAEANPWLIVVLDLPLFVLTTVSVITFYVVATRATTGSGRSMVRYIPFLMAVGIGLCINNARAVLEALGGRASEFARTPKYNLRPGDGLQRRRYRGRVNADTAVEAVLAVYFAGAIVAVATAGIWGAVPFLLLFELGFAYSAYSTLRQTVVR